MANVRLVIEYDGRAFHGFQRQATVITVQSELERVLKIVCGQEIGAIHGSGRTDAGVHARGQVVHFHVDTEPNVRRIITGVNALLHGKLSVLHADIAPEGFHSRASARKKQYSYRMLIRYAPPTTQAGMVWHVYTPIDVERMKKEAKVFIGTKDFSSFRSSGCPQKSPIRTIFESEITADGENVTFRVVGSGFLRNMVRIMVGTLVEVCSESGTKGVAEIMEAKDRGKAGITAPPQGLYLDWVEYPPEFAFPSAKT